MSTVTRFGIVLATTALTIAGIGAAELPASAAAHTAQTASTASTRTASAVATPPAAVIAAPAGAAVAAFDRMSEAERVGQLLMVGTPATRADAAAMSDVVEDHVGNIILTGRSTGGTSVPAATAAAFQARPTAGVGLFVATDQEGGQVQVLEGPGLSGFPPHWHRAAIPPPPCAATPRPGAGS